MATHQTALSTESALEQYSAQSLATCFDSLRLWQELQAYETRLAAARDLPGRLRLAVLRRLLRRLVPYQKLIITDLESAQQTFHAAVQFWQTYNAAHPDDPEGESEATALRYLQRSRALLGQFTQSVLTPNAASLDQLETIFQQLES